MIKINNDWEFIEKWNDSFINGIEFDKKIRIPHTVEELPLHYANSDSYQKICGYKKRIFFDSKNKDERHFIKFDGTAHIATVYLNDTKIITNKCGYTSFTCEITENIIYDKENTITVKLDSYESNNIPPFGFVIDYLTYGGIYRDVWLINKPKQFIKDVFIKTPSLNDLEIEVEFDGLKDETTYLVKIFLEDEEIINKTFSTNTKIAKLYIENTKPWSIDSPTLYKCIVTLKEDTFETTFGFRTLKVTQNQFLLNDKPVFIMGLNRHQSYPYIGYAATSSLQKEDAKILKHELKCNAVRTSHYPQSHYFIDECDKLGILVFIEIPGWQHIGDENWKKQVLINTEEMVKQYRNHPSIIIWGVRINESVDDDKLYEKTNKIAKNLDPTRLTGGVRYITKSNLLEDIYTFNDFSHNGTNKGALNKKEVMTNVNKPLLITESNGHMFPTKSFDTQSRLQEHALRHARVLNDAIKDKQHIGVFQWCMFDYATHKDFGSGDRICYHGVLDSFRNPKLAASVYSSQQDNEAILEVSTSMDIGDYNAGNIDNFYVFTNADEIKMYKNDQYISTYKNTPFSSLTHGPILIEDIIGKQLESNENFTYKQAETIKKCLLAVKKHGTNLPLKYKLLFGWAMLRYKMSYDDGVKLYGKYISSWGQDSIKYRFDAIKNNKVIKSVTKCPNTNLHLDIKVSNTTLYEGDTYDMSLVRIKVLDMYNNVARYAQIPINVEIIGPIEIIGPKTIVAEGGMCGLFIKTIGETGNAQLKIKALDLEEKTINFTIK